MPHETIKHIRAHVVRDGGGDYHDHAGSHWITGRIATPMSRYPAYRDSRNSFGIGVLGTVVVEVESDSGAVGVGISTGGAPACWIIEHHLARFVEGADPVDIERIWDQMYRATLFYGRKGLVLNAISAVDLAIWDLLGVMRQEPAYALLGGAVHEELACYATGPRPDLAKQMGFVGGKMIPHHGPVDGEAGLRAELENAQAMRERVGSDFWLAYDCWMALDVPYAVRLAHGLAEFDVRWLEEPLPPDDYWGYAELRRRFPPKMLLTGGEHEATRWGFRLLLEMGQVDIVQPDVGWCGGITELLKISALAEAYGAMVVPHASSVYSYHFMITRPSTVFVEFLMMHPDASDIVPQFHPLLVDEPVPVNGRIKLPDRPGFGVRLNPDIALDRPFSH